MISYNVKKKKKLWSFLTIRQVCSISFSDCLCSRLSNEMVTDVSSRLWELNNVNIFGFVLLTYFAVSYSICMIKVSLKP